MQESMCQRRCTFHEVLCRIGLSTHYKNAIFLLGKLYIIHAVITTSHVLVSAYDYDSRPPGVPPPTHLHQEKQGTTHKLLSAIIVLTSLPF